MPIANGNSSPRVANSNNIVRSASSNIKASGIKSAISRVTADNNSEGSVQNGEHANEGNTKTNESDRSAGTYSSGQSAERAVGRFQQALTNPASYGAPMAPGGGPGGAGAALAGGAGAIGAGLGKLGGWGGTGAQAAASGKYAGGGGSGGGGGCNGGGCGGGGGGGSISEGLGVTQNNNNNGSSQPQNNSNTVQTIEANMQHGGHPSGPLSDLAKEVISSDKPMIIKVGTSWCGPCQKWNASEKSKVAGANDVGFKDVDGDSQKALAKALGAESYPSFFIASRDENGKVQFKALGSGSKSAESLLESARGSGHVNKEKLAENLAKAKETQAQENSGKIEERNSNIEKAQKVLRSEDKNNPSVQAYADMMQKVKVKGEDVPFGETLKKDATSYFAKTNEDGTRKLSTKSFEGAEEVKFSDLEIPGKEKGSMTKLGDFASETNKLYEEAKNRPDPEPETQNNTESQEGRPNNNTPVENNGESQLGRPSESPNTELSGLAKEINDEINKKAVVCANNQCKPNTSLARELTDDATSYFKGEHGYSTKPDSPEDIKTAKEMGIESTLLHPEEIKFSDADLKLKDGTAVENFGQFKSYINENKAEESQNKEKEASES